VKKVKYIVRSVLVSTIALVMALSPLSSLPVEGQTAPMWVGDGSPAVSLDGPAQPIKWPPGVFCQDT